MRKSKLLEIVMTTITSPMSLSPWSKISPVEKISVQNEAKRGVICPSL